MANNVAPIIRQIGERITGHDHAIVELVKSLEEIAQSTSDIRIMRTYLAIARGYLEECMEEAIREEAEFYGSQN